VSFPRCPAYKDSGVERLGEVPGNVGHWKHPAFRTDEDWPYSDAKGTRRQGETWSGPEVSPQITPSAPALRRAGCDDLPPIG
jgi:hypothetical protein